jgi:hypothetical protein
VSFGFSIYKKYVESSLSKVFFINRKKAFTKGLVLLTDSPSGITIGNPISSLSKVFFINRKKAFARDLVLLINYPYWRFP